jgi:6-phosphogluconolactonase
MIQVMRRFMSSVRRFSCRDSVGIIGIGTGVILFAVAGVSFANDSGVVTNQCQSEPVTAEAVAEEMMDNVYVSLGNARRIVHFHLDRQTGRLTRKSDLEVPGTPGSQVARLDRRQLYVAMRSIKSVSRLLIDPQSGALTLDGTTPVAENPVYLYLDRPGRHLLMSSYSGNLAAIYPLDERGVMTATPTMVLETERNPHSIMLDPSGRYGYIPNTGSDSIWQLHYDQEKGVLTPNDPDRLATEGGAGPRHFYFHPTLSVVYFVNETNSSVTAFRLDADTGKLEKLQSLSTLPEGYQDKANNTCADIEVTPCGRFLYASNRGHDSLAGYAIDSESGKLTILGRSRPSRHPFVQYRSQWSIPARGRSRKRANRFLPH